MVREFLFTDYFNENLKKISNYEIPPLKAGGYQFSHSENNPLCGDAVHLQLNIADRKISVGCHYEGCLLVKTSLSFLQQMVQNEYPEKILQLVQQIESKLFHDNSIEISMQFPHFEDLMQIYQLPARISCVWLPWRALRELILKLPKR